MPWCPNCKMEYRNGITKCADCGNDLVDELPVDIDYEELIRIETQENAGKLVEFLHYSDIENVECTFDEEDNSYVIKVEASKLKESKRLFHAFYVAEAEKDMQKKQLDNELDFENPYFDESEDYEDTIDEIETKHTSNNSKSGVKRSSEDENAFNNMVLKPSTVYVKKADQFKDLHSTGYTFIVFGIIGIVVLVLNYIGVMNLFSGFLSYGVMGFLFVFFFITGVSTLSKSKHVRTQISEEDAITTKINTWLDQNITIDVLATVNDENASEEVNYFKKTEYIRERIIHEFGEIDDSYLDLLIEEYYNSKF
ncbi:MAG TPA: hypothetical protein VHP81_14195 [Lachnospiraceae bacterium]|nr:hypothetical protein [Lachnospiraceae bacterium]